jgi:serine/threonine protein kinase
MTAVPWRALKRKNPDMPDSSPLKSGDPERLGAYEIRGRLGEGGQGVVYLGENASGEQFAIKWLRSDLAGDPVSRERFLREVAAAQRVAAFCTAQVVETGLEQDRPYIVSEYISGPSLQALVVASGPRTGSSLHRLAVGTATALAAIHQAGIVHRDFKPANVLMGPDGPRVIDFGIAKALDGANTVTSRPVGTPSYMAPEQLTGLPVGPPADLFSWASTMVYAATGDAPFGSDTLPAVINRILNAPPRLDLLDGPLREVVASCLDKDPARRPTAEQVLLRLLQQPSSAAPAMLLHEAAAAAAADTPSGAHPVPRERPAEVSGPTQVTGPPTIGTRQRSSTRRLTMVSSAAGAAVAVAAVGAFVALNGTGGIVNAGASPAFEAAAQPRPSAALPTENLTTTRLPDVQATAYEHPDDAISLAGFTLEREKDGWVSYPRTSRNGAFTRAEKYFTTSPSPDRTLEAGRTRSYTPSGYHAIDIIDRRTGRVRPIDVVKRPLTYDSAEWTKDSRRLLLTMKDPQAADWTTVGFIVVDVAAGTAKAVRILDDSIKGGRFYWTPDETGVTTGYAHAKGFGLRFYDLDGRTTRELPEVGEPYNTSTGLFSPSGRSFATRCPAGRRGTCLWDTASGDRTAAVSSDCVKVLGWYDESRLYCWAPSGDGGTEVVVFDRRGAKLRVLLKTNATADIGPFYLREDRG